ncbi:MAG TPA: glycosyltransferase family 39 protein, partial [Candidatus Binataceae bacterium]|nr:glycosyltransferase family 39 protein [Candidatus Binataceae bacterium]
PLIDWDEATYAEVAHEAVASHSYLDFTWNGQPYLKKPPLLFWSVAASFKTFGESEFAARLPSVIMGLGTLLLLYAMAAEVLGRFGGFFAGIVPLGFYFFVARGGRECATDAPLIFFSTLAIFALGRARKNPRWVPLIGLACGLGILSKGLAGLIPLAVACISIIALPAFSAVGLAGLAGVLAVTAAVAAPWFVYQAAHNGTLFWSTYVKQETLMRVAKHLEDNPHAASFTVRTFMTEVRHLWPLILPLAGISAAFVQRRNLRGILRIPAPIVVWILWFVLAFLAACAVQTKLGWYVLPALIPFALIAASVVAAALAEAGPARDYCRPLAIIAMVLLVLTEMPNWGRIEGGFAIQRGQSMPSYEMAMRADALAAIRGSGELYFAGLPLPTMVYYSDMRCHFVSPSEPDFELTDLGGNPVSVAYHEVALKDAEGVVTAVDNFDEEWSQSAPAFERTPTLDTRDASAVSEEARPAAE